jgi:hypothetical protein
MLTEVTHGDFAMQRLLSLGAGTGVGAVPARVLSDAVVIDAVVIDALATVGTPEGLYGRRKMTAILRRQGLAVASCTADPLMRHLGLSGVRRGRRVRHDDPGQGWPAGP